MKIIMVTGMSGAGKSVALKTLEDCGFEAIDNIPLTLLSAVAASSTGKRPLALGADVRSRDFSAEHLVEAIRALKQHPSLDLKLLFLDADDEVLARRFTTTRRRHPLAQDRQVMDGIRQERKLVYDLRDAADLVIDTSDLEAAELRHSIISHFVSEGQHLSISLISFSFTRGVPREADIVFDVRFLKNPFYDEALRAGTGLDAEVGAYVESDKDFSVFFDRLTGLLMPLLPRYLQEGKSYLTVAIGCTGGQHRSVYVVRKLGGFLQDKGYNVTLKYRDMKPGEGKAAL